MLADLAGLVHRRQSAHGDKHNDNEDDNKGALHHDLIAPGHSLAESSWFKNEPVVNGLANSPPRSKSLTFIFIFALSLGTIDNASAASTLKMMCSAAGSFCAKIWGPSSRVLVRLPAIHPATTQPLSQSPPV